MGLYMYRFIFGLALFLIFPGLVNGQEFVSVSGSELYPALGENAYIPPNGNYAILRCVVRPSYFEPGAHNIESASIVLRADYVAGMHTRNEGWYTNDGDTSTLYSIIDAQNVYVRGQSPFNSRFLTQIQTLLTAQNLGTVAQRRAYIQGIQGVIEFQSLVDVSGIFASVLEIVKPYAVIMIGLYGSLFLLGKAFKHLEDFVNQRHKLQVKVERRAERIAQKNDPVYGILKLGLDFRAAKYASTRSRVDYKEYKAAFKQYAAYRKKKGWRY